MSKKREQWSVRLGDGKTVTLAARTEREARRLAGQRHKQAVVSASLVGGKATLPPTKPKAIPGVSGTAKRASHPATPPLTPERVKQLAVEGIVEVVGKGLRDLLKGLMG